MSKIYTVAVIGIGARGKVYTRLMNRTASDKFKITHLCEQNEELLHKMGDEFELPASNRFTSEEEFFTKRHADILVIATPDDCHTRQLLRAMELGYDILCEKPLTDKKEECDALLEAHKKYGNKILVCHVLRYAKAYIKLKEIIDSGVIGKLMAINWTEPVGYWHYAHSYVRGNWRNTRNSAPMIMAKCCHDLDMIQHFAGAKCKSVSSIGDLSFFKPECAPEGAAERCCDCALKSTCPYSAYRIYLDVWKERNCSPRQWPCSVLTGEPVTEEKIIAALENGPYGRCVFHSDNNVVDHQTVQMQFENDITATLHMNGFNMLGERRITLFGTYGEVTMNEHELILSVFGKPTEVIDMTITDENGLGYTHGGGDAGMIKALYDMISGQSTLETSIDASIESHLIAIKAEESRLAGGKMLLVHE